MSPAPVRDAKKQTVRAVAASFLAGMGVMVAVGFIAPVLAKGGLSIRDAWASTVEEKTPVIAPLDVEAIEAQLAQSDAAMQAARAATEDEMHDLEIASNH